MTTHGWDRKRTEKRYKQRTAMFKKIAEHLWLAVMAELRARANIAREEGEATVTLEYYNSYAYDGYWQPWFREALQYLPDIAEKAVAKNRWLRSFKAKIEHGKETRQNGSGDDYFVHSESMVLQVKRPKLSQDQEPHKPRSVTRIRPTLDANALRRVKARSLRNAAASVSAEEPKKRQLQTMYRAMAKHRLDALLVLLSYELMWLAEDREPLQFELNAAYTTSTLRFALGKDSEDKSHRCYEEEAFVELLQAACKRDKRLTALRAKYGDSSSSPSGSVLGCGLITCYHKLTVRVPEAATKQRRARRTASRRAA